MTFAIVATFCCVCAGAGADAPGYSWKSEKDVLSLMAGPQVVYSMHFAAEGGYPYVHPLGLPGGPLMSAFAPADHPWHRGLWFSWKFLNGVNYWEFPHRNVEQPDGKTAVVKSAVSVRKTIAKVHLKLQYSKVQVILTEERTLVASLPQADGSYTIAWDSKFTAKGQDVVFQRTPPQDAAWGGYGGLGFRAAATMRDFRATDSEGRTGRALAHGKQAKWMDFSGAFGEKGQKTATAGVAIFDHPSNPRHPTHWYLSDNADLPYFGPALLFAEPLTLQAGESFRLRYLILVHPGLGEKPNLDKQYASWTEESGSEGVGRSK